MPARQIGPLKLKAQMLCGPEFAIGPGKADVLDAIDREGSISAAGRALGMSYRRVWLLVDSLNRCWTEPLVETHAGGGAGRGAVLTPLGREVAEAYRALQADLARAAQESAGFATLSRLMRDAPRASQKGDA